MAMRSSARCVILIGLYWLAGGASPVEPPSGPEVLGAVRVQDSDSPASSPGRHRDLIHQIPRREAIVTPYWVKQQKEALGSRLVVLEVSWDAKKESKEYREGHVPGAIHFNTDDFENGSPRWYLRSASNLHDAIGRAGISPNSTVVVYGKQVIAAARVWWVLLYAGVADVRFLNGGYAAWIRAGFAGERTWNQPTAVPFRARVRSQYLATTAYLQRHYLSNQVVLADVRSREEYQGQVSGYPYLDARGRIPGAIHAQNADDSAAIYQNRDGTLRDPEEIRVLWQKQGLIRGKGMFEREVIFYCGTGWRSSLGFLYAWAMGVDQIRNYSDGWSGWSTIYRREPGCEGSTPGWRQTRSGNPSQP